MKNITKEFAYRVSLGFITFLTLGFATLWEMASIPCEQYESLIHAAISNIVTDKIIPFNIHPHGIHYAAHFLHEYMDWSWAFFIIQSIYWLLYIVSIYICASSLFNEKIGLWASIAFISSAHSPTALHTFVLDHPLGAVLMAQTACYILSNRFSKRIPSILFLLFIPLGFFTKYAYIMYALPLIGTAALDILFYKKTRKLGTLTAFLSSCLMMAVISGVLLLFINSEHAKLLTLYGTSNTSSIVPKIHSLKVFYNLSVSYLLAFTADIKQKQLQPIGFWLALIGLIHTLCMKTPRAKLLIFWLPIIFLEFFIDLFTYDDNRYYYPLLGGWFIIAVYWLERLKYLGSIPIIILGIGGLITSAGWLYNYPNIASARTLSFDLSNIKITRVFLNSFDEKTGNYYTETKPITNCQTGWSDSLFFTFEPRNYNAAPALEIALKVPDKQDVLLRDYPSKVTLQTFQNAAELFAFLIWQDGMDKRYYMQGQFTPNYSYSEDQPQKPYIIILHHIKETNKMTEVFDDIEEPRLARTFCENCVFELYRMKI